MVQVVLVNTNNNEIHKENSNNSNSMTDPTATVSTSHPLRHPRQQQQQPMQRQQSRHKTTDDDVVDRSSSSTSSSFSPKSVTHLKQTNTTAVSKAIHHQDQSDHDPHVEDTVENHKTTTTAATAVHFLEQVLAKYRNAVSSWKRQRPNPNLDNIQDWWQHVALLYYKMGTIHLQLCRYTTALHVLDHALETLLTRCCGSYHHHHGDGGSSSNVQLPRLLTLEEAIPLLPHRALLLVATIMTTQAKIRVAQGFPEMAQERAELIMRYLRSERFQRRIDQNSCTSRSNHILANDWSLAMARAQVVLGQSYASSNRPDWAMKCFQEALMIQRYILGDDHVHVADTVHRIADLHTSQGLLGQAVACYQEALRVYQKKRIMAVDVFVVTDEIEETDDYNLAQTLSADVATILASLGWIYLLQHDFENAVKTTHEALDLTVQSLGPSHRNVASLQYQLGWIQWWDSYSVPEKPNNRPSRTALSQWKKVLIQQERVLLSTSTATAIAGSSAYGGDSHRNLQNPGATTTTFLRHHTDIAKTLHAMGLAYQAAGRNDRARTVFHAADGIYIDNTNRMNAVMR